MCWCLLLRKTYWYVHVPNAQLLTLVKYGVDVNSPVVNILVLLQIQNQLSSIERRLPLFVLAPWESYHARLELCNDMNLKNPQTVFGNIRMLQQHATDGGNRNNAWKWECSSKTNQDKYFIMLKILQTSHDKENSRAFPATNSLNKLELRDITTTCIRRRSEI